MIAMTTDGLSFSGRYNCFWIIFEATIEHGDITFRATKATHHYPQVTKYSNLIPITTDYMRSFLITYYIRYLLKFAKKFIENFI